jgi:hypothetical protein
MSRSTSHSDTFSPTFHLAKPACGAAASKRHFLQRMYGEAELDRVLGYLAFRKAMPRGDVAEFTAFN